MVEAVTCSCNIEVGYRGICRRRKQGFVMQCWNAMMHNPVRYVGFLSLLVFLMFFFRIRNLVLMAWVCLAVGGMWSSCVLIDGFSAAAAAAAIVGRNSGGGPSARESGLWHRVWYPHHSICHCHCNVHPRCCFQDVHYSATRRITYHSHLQSAGR